MRERKTTFCGPDPTGNKPDPCRGLTPEQRLVYMRAGLSSVQLNLGLNQSGKLLNPGNRSLQDIANALEGVGWDRFRTNINPQHWGGIHFEGLSVREKCFRPEWTTTHLHDCRPIYESDSVLSLEFHPQRVAVLIARVLHSRYNPVDG